jgi:transporter family protein
MIWLLWAMISRFLYAGGIVIQSEMGNSLYKTPIQQLIFRHLLCIPLMLGFFFWLKPAMPPPDLWPWIAACGILSGTYLLPYYTALRMGDASAIAAMFVLGRVMVPFTAFFIIEERLGSLEWVGFLIAVSASLMLSYDPKRTHIGFRPFLWMLLCGTLIAIYVTMAKRVFIYYDVLPAVTWIMTIACLPSFCLFCIPSVHRDVMTIWRQNRKRILQLQSPCIVMMLAADAIFFYALSLAKASHVTISGVFQPFFVLAIGYTLTKLGWVNVRESYTPEHVTKKVICFLFMALGLAISLWDSF